MLGSLCGDQVGARYEGRNKPSCSDFMLFTKKSCFTDDTVQTVALADSILNKKDFAKTLKEYYKKYPYVGYGKGFINWAKSDSFTPYNSYGNGSAMRVSPIIYTCSTINEVLEKAKKSAEVTHNSKEGIMGAQAVALAIYMARKGESKYNIYRAMVDGIGYDLSNVKKGFFSSCQDSVPQALMAFFESTDFIDAIRRAVLFMGDADTLACIAGSIAQEYYGEGLDAIPQEVILNTFERLPDDLSDITVRFIHKYIDASFERPAKMTTEAIFHDLFRSIFNK